MCLVLSKCHPSHRYVIPTPVIHHFLTDYQRNGQFTGFPSLGIRWQRMESDHLRCDQLISAVQHK